MRDLFIKTLSSLTQKNSKIMLLTGDLGFSVFDEFKERFPKNFINVGVAEQNMTGIAAGLALEGKKVFTYSIGNFPTFRCLEQIRNDICYHDLNVTIVSVGAGFSYGALGMSHHATEDIAIMRSIPHMNVICPSGEWEIINATKEIVESLGPNYLRIDKSMGDDRSGIKNEQFKIGKGRILFDGSHGTVLVTGGILEEAIIARDELLKDGIKVKIISMPTVKPIDKHLIIEECKKTNILLTIEEHNIDGGLGGAVAEVIADNSISVIFRRVGLKNQFSSIVGTQKYLRKKYKMDSVAIIKLIRDLLR